MFNGWDDSIPAPKRWEEFDDPRPKKNGMGFNPRPQVMKRWDSIPSPPKRKLGSIPVYPAPKRWLMGMGLNPNPKKLGGPR